MNDKGNEEHWMKFKETRIFGGVMVGVDGDVAKGQAAEAVGFGIVK